nr:iron hydrogenase small subunit [Eubacterium sp.]
PEVQTVYEEYFKEPCGEKSHHLLHTDHHGWEMNPAASYDPDVVID